jgi:hypothetical protein
VCGFSETIATSPFHFIAPRIAHHNVLHLRLQQADSDKQVLRISLDPRDGVLVYDFQETGSTLPKYQHWIRRCSPDEGFARFERFVQLKNGSWITGRCLNERNGLFNS